RGLGQDPRVLPARRLPQDPVVRGLRPGVVVAPVRDQAERPDPDARLLHQDRQLARHAGRFGPGSMTALPLPASTARSAKADLSLIVGIDTESDDQWSLAARERPTFENLYALPALHERFRRHGVRPTYVITWPVARDPRSAGVLRALHASPTCEVGAHHHAWETPPSTPADLKRHLYALDLSADRFDAQLAAVTDAIEDAVCPRPVSYRSGRFGFSAAHVSSLEQAGYLVDSSVSPLFCEAHKGGPDFADAPPTPYYLAYEHARRPGSSGVLELPLSSALHRRMPRALALAWARA